MTKKKVRKKVKLTAANNAFLKQCKKRFDPDIYKIILDLANKKGINSAMAAVRRGYVIDEEGWKIPLYGSRRK